MDKHLNAVIKIASIYGAKSNCTRQKHACIVFHKDSFEPIAFGYNGGPQGGTALCAVNGCARTDSNVPSGEKIEIGCIHAEMNAICNAARRGISLKGHHVFITRQPCLMCAKLLHQAGIADIYCNYDPSAPVDGYEFLTNNGHECLMELAW